MLDFVHHNTSTYWANRFLDRLEDTATEPRPAAKRLRVSEGRVSQILSRAKRPLVLLDYDGTLRGYESKPSAAVPTGRVRKILAELCNYATVYIVSGRKGDTLESWFGDLPIGLVCEHGLATRPFGSRGWEQRKTSGRNALRNVEPLFEEFARRTPGSLVERKRASIAWHYRAADPEYATFQAHELLSLLEDVLKRRPYQVLRGNRVIEVRHESISKGHATTDLLQRHADADAVFVAGDDRTDEDMMEAVSRSWRSRAITCWVGVRSVHAEYWVESSDALVTELELLLRTWMNRPKPKVRRASKRPPSPASG
jgi:trehalose 6-phosphate synthase/phosphatase